ncbi:type II toxin-antitoxin system HipA family toxin [Serinicoccus chungangensis]|uniref:type II toxin-antitoxin system HipA family toxin n=1 Tax=Serinicoccus chungangensis TaxID=767452 RepID=UPI0009F975F1|nr:type II toxin-antitoxin system HipA family toxin [Serinicoccus chungangensis]
MQSFDVRLDGIPVGQIIHEGERSEFFFVEEYLDLPLRPILGLAFEDDLRRRHVSSVSLPNWFSNLLPEGILRTWIAEDANVSPAREMELLARVGHDLPGAVEVVPGGEVRRSFSQVENAGAPLNHETHAEGVGFRFSLAGVALKFSMVRRGTRLALPAYGRGGDWIVKTPNAHFHNVPANEFVMMRWARHAGVAVPDVDLVHRDELQGLPAEAWPNGEELAYAVRRFDREPANRHKIHIEDFCQVRDWHPLRKYDGTYETLAALAWRGVDDESLREIVRRLVFNALIGNSDAHLKNWSLQYEDPGHPSLSPAYDLVATSSYSSDRNFKRMALKLNGRREFESLRLGTFDRLGRRIGYEGDDLSDVARDTLERTLASKEILSEYRERLGDLIVRESLMVAAAREATLTGSLFTQRP